VLVNVKTARKVKIEEIEGLDQAVAAVEQQLGDRGRVLLRASGTEPLIRVMVEGEDQEQVTKFANQLADEVKSSIAP